MTRMNKQAVYPPCPSAIYAINNCLRKNRAKNGLRSIFHFLWFGLLGVAATSHLFSKPLSDPPANNAFVYPWFDVQPETELFSTAQLRRHLGNPMHRLAFGDPLSTSLKCHSDSRGAGRYRYY